LYNGHSLELYQMSDILNRLAQHKLLPIIVMDDASQATGLGDVLVKGGLPVVEVTFRTAAAEASIRTLAKRGDLLVGAGTILTIEQADRAIDAGAQFLVSPGTNPKVVEHAYMRKTPMMPGIATPSEIDLALSLGAAALKFFPAENLGGVATLKAFAGPYPDVRFIPTGGITPELVPGYLRMKQVIACGGSWMAPREFLKDGRFDAIAALLEDAKKLLAGPPDVAT
jgi:2-dehydro-3-deoxyphosphogluconate aldolase/(4S)-4-hydroxy-2-oxoglutarate aldolase